MALGRSKLVIKSTTDTATLNEWRAYYKSVHNDYRGLLNVYPFSELSIYPTIIPQLAVLRVVAVNINFVERTGACRSDFITEFSKELYISIPLDYKESGCDVYGGEWIIPSKLNDSDMHFYKNDVCPLDSFNGYKFCVGTPDSFKDMKNVILENVRTAENMLIAYERYMRGDSANLTLISYSHGDCGRKEYRKNKNKYIPK